MGRQALRAVTTFVVFTALCLQGCSTTPSREGRIGLFDRLMESRHRISIGPKPVVFTDAEKDRIQSWTRTWSRPLELAIVNSEFGVRGDRLHEGIDLKARTGTKVFAAAAGRVLYSSARIHGYGRMIVIDHGDQLATVYAHLSKSLVSEGQNVRKGQLIAKSGATGRVSGPHLHFELRYGTAAVNPEQVASAKFYKDIPPVSKSHPAKRALASSKAQKKKKKKSRG